MANTGASRLEQSQERRRRDALKRQKEARRNLTNHARQLACDQQEQQQQHDEGEHVDTNMDSSRRSRREKKHTQHSYVRERALRWWREVPCPEWLVEIPKDLGSGGWLAVPRPEGKRCVLVSSRGRVVARTTSGDVLDQFECRWPNDTVVECVWSSGEYWALDVACWGGYSLYDCAAEFRFYWLASKLQEVEEVRVKAVPFFSSRQLIDAYSSPLPYARDGLLFYDKEGYYELGLTPLVCLWKDHATTRYFRQIDSCVLEIDEQNRLVTLDGMVVPERLVGDDASAVTAEERNKLSPGDLARFDLIPASSEGFVAVFKSACSAKRPAADSSTKLTFALAHYRAQPITIQQLLAAASVEIDPSTHSS